MNSVKQPTAIKFAVGVTYPITKEICEIKVIGKETQKMATKKKAKTVKKSVKKSVK